jgi:hypothetical protein
MNDHLRDRILRKLDTLTDERGYQVLDYVEFLESRYAERQQPGQNAFSRFTEAVEDKMRAGKVSAQTISETMGLLNRAVGILNGVAAAGRSVANDLVDAATRVTTPPATSGAPGSATPPSGSPSPASGTTSGTAGAGGAGTASAGTGGAPSTPPTQSPASRPDAEADDGGDAVPNPSPS